MQNADPPNQPARNNEEAPNQGWGVWPEPPAHPMPPPLMNYQAWLASHGLTVMHGVVPDNNVTDNPMQAWHEAITESSEYTSSEESDATVSDLLVMPVTSPGAFSAALAAPSTAADVVTISVDIHDQGMRFGLSAQSDSLLEILLSNPIPRQQLNTVLFHDVRPLLATRGPWAAG